MVAHRAGGDDLQAVLVQLGRVEADLVGDDDDLRVGRLARVEAEAARAAGDDDADVASVSLLAATVVDDRLAISSRGIGISGGSTWADSYSRSTCSLEPEDPAGVDADALEHAVAVEQAVVVDADLGVALSKSLPLM